MTKIRTLIVEDEKANADLLTYFLSKYCPDISIIGIAKSKREALVAIEAELPDLLFLDIVLDADSAFDLLKEIDYFSIQVIFISAYTEYALEAFRYNAVDYLLKPLQIDELLAAVSRVITRMVSQEFLSQSDIQKNYRVILGAQKYNFVAIHRLNDIILIKNEEIRYCKSIGRHTEFYLTNKKYKESSKSLGYYELILNQFQFYRIHKSYIINLNQVGSLNRKRGVCQLTDGSELPISRKRIETLVRF